MAAFIFSNSTYVIGFNYSADVHATINNSLHDTKIRFLAIDQLNKISSSIEKITHVACVFINTHEISMDDLKNAIGQFEKFKFKIVLTYPLEETKNSNLKLKLVHPIKYNSESFKSIINQKILDLTPKGLEQILLGSLNTISTSLLADDKLQFQVQKVDNFSEYQYIVICDSNSKDSNLSTRCYINFEKYKSLSPKNFETTEFQIFDIAKELVNQVMGLIAQSLRNHGKYDLKLTVPNILNNSDSLSIKKSYYIPYQSFSDNEGVFHFEMGLLCLDNKTHDFTSITVDVSEEVEFF